MDKAEGLQAMKFYKEKLFNGIFKDKIEAFDIAADAIEKQIPKKPRHHKEQSNCGAYYTCRCCGNWVLVTHHFCCKCGQALEWSDIE